MLVLATLITLAGDIKQAQTITSKISTDQLADVNKYDLNDIQITKEGPFLTLYKENVTNKRILVPEDITQEEIIKITNDTIQDIIKAKKAREIPQDTVISTYVYKLTDK